MNSEILPASPHRRGVQPSSSSSPFSKKLAAAAAVQPRAAAPATADLGWSALFRRHQFLLLTLAILTFLCTVYLYFAVTLGATMTDTSCEGLTGTQRAVCNLRHRGSRKILRIQTGSVQDHLGTSQMNENDASVQEHGEFIHQERGEKRGDPFFDP